jgi:hypothetical protein
VYYHLPLTKNGATRWVRYDDPILPPNRVHEELLDVKHIWDKDVLVGATILRSTLRTV